MIKAIKETLFTTRYRLETNEDKCSEPCALKTSIDIMMGNGLHYNIANRAKDLHMHGQMMHIANRHLQSYSLTM